MGDLAFRATSSLTGAVMAGEALAILVGMHVLSQGDDAWVSVKNDLFLALDLVTGLRLVYLAPRSEGRPGPVPSVSWLALPH